MEKLAIVILIALMIPAVHAGDAGPGDLIRMLKDVLVYIINFFSNPESNFSESAINDEVARSGLAQVRIEHRSFFSSVLMKQRNYTVLLPPGSAGRYPVYYLLHGAWGDERTWATRGEIVRIYQEMLDSGLGGMIIAMPDGDNTVWESECGMMACGNYEGYFLEFMDEIESRYETNGSAIGGLSFGARGAMRLAFMNPDRFNFVGSHSGYYHYLIQEMDEEKWNRLNASGITIYFDNSKNDPLTEYSQSSLLLNQTLAEKGIRHEYRELDFPAVQSHAWPYWKQQVMVALEKACEVIC